jgi:ribosomal protein L11 methyltransferase
MAQPDPHEIAMVPGAGWGDGSHETTHLCLQAIRFLHPKKPAFRALDFGSGSGLLSIAAARLGATVDAVEIDEAAVPHAKKNAELNGVGGQIRYWREIPHTAPEGPYDLIVANILRPVLLHYAEDLASRLSPQGVLILSGVVATEIPELSVRYSSWLLGRFPEVYRRGEWRAIVWKSN